MTKDQFITTMSNLIKAYCDSRHLPEHIADLSLCQACLESGYGQSQIMMSNNAPYGIKATNNKPFYEVATKEYINGQYITVKAKFCKYETLSDSIIDYFQLLNWSRYKPVLDSKDFNEASEQIRLCGYATSPTYTTSLRRVYDDLKGQSSSDYNFIINTKNDPLNVRKMPDIKSSILTSIPKDTKVKGVKDWTYLPEYGGWVYNKYLEEI